MDGDDLSESEPSQPKSLAEIFTEVFPYYLAMGMTYEEFWFGAPSLVRAYRKAWDIKQHNEEYARWRSGMYFYNALLCVAPVLRPFTKGDVKPGNYPDRPYPLTQKEADEQEREREEENFKRYLAQMEAASERELKRREEAMKKEAIENERHD